jgi:hypothetical protein
MAVILNDGSIFLHIPKTGGIWVTKVLQESGLVKRIITPQHADFSRAILPINQIGYSYTWRQTASLLAKKSFGQYPKQKPLIFCFIRHPLLWYESYFRYMSTLEITSNGRWKNWHQFGHEGWWHPWNVLSDVESHDFNQFVRNVNHQSPGYVTQMLGWYTTPEVDFIGKQENLRQDLVNILNNLNLKFDEDFIMNYSAKNTSHKSDEKIVWEPDVKAETERLEYAGLVRYGYTNPKEA